MTDLSITRRKVIEYCLTLPFSYEDYPFGDTADAGAWTVMRHKANRKGFAHIYERHGKMCVNLKCDPIEADFLRQAFVDVTPAYHRNFCFAKTAQKMSQKPDIF